MQTYYAKSVLLSKTIWINVLLILLTILEAKDVINVLPGGAMKYVPAAIAVINIILRPFTVRPVALIPPGKVKAVSVPTLPLTASTLHKGAS